MDSDSELQEQGQRLREERMRLGMTQEGFATACGVQRRTQISYEAGKRSPDLAYLRSASGIGVDTQYVCYGLRTNKESYEYAKQRQVLELIAMELDIEVEKVQPVVEEVNRVFESEPDGSDETEERAIVRAFLRQSPYYLDTESFFAVSEAVDLALAKVEFLIPSRKRARILVMAYRSFKVTGRVDPAMIEEAVRLAGS